LDRLPSFYFYKKTFYFLLSKRYLNGYFFNDYITFEGVIQRVTHDYKISLFTKKKEKYIVIRKNKK
jgi:hypothetical protein